MKHFLLAALVVGCAAALGGCEPDDALDMQVAYIGHMRGPVWCSDGNLLPRCPLTLEADFLNQSWPKVRLARPLLVTTDDRIEFISPNDGRGTWRVLVYDKHGYLKDSTRGYQ